MLRALAHLAGLRIVGFDVVEVSPGTDLSSRTALLAAILVREALLRLTEG